MSVYKSPYSNIDNYYPNNTATRTALYICLYKYL